MISKGKLKEYLLTPIMSQWSETLRACKGDDEADNGDKNHRYQDDNPRRQHLPPPPTHGTIHMLIKTKDSTSRKRYAWEFLHFDHEKENIIHRFNGTRVKYPYYDTLIITTRIYGWYTNWVYINTGSNINMVFKKLLEKVKVSLSQITHNFGPTFGVGWDAILTLGVDTLPLMLIGTTVLKTLDFHSIMTEFLVWDLSSFFSSIIGWSS